MTDPAKLAEDADACAARVEANRLDGTEFVMLSLTAQESRMIAAALRLAEAVPAHFSDDVWSYCVVCNGAPGTWEFASDETPIQHKPGCLLTAYRAAKEEAK